MADSDAVRSARKRKHAQGDHSLCRTGRCAGAARTELGARIAELGEIDPGAELVALVRRLIAASEADPVNTAVARELRATLAVLPERREMDPLERRQATVEARAAAHRAGLLADVVPFRSPWARISPKEG